METKKYLIIGGTSKAGTTSLYDYLAAHPQINASYIKQTFFFLDNEWQNKLDLKALYDYQHGLDQFDHYFDCQNQEKYRMEASPEYLYAPDTPKRLDTFLKYRSGKIIIILREPASRFNSYFHFGKQQGLIPQDMSYSQFYNASKNYKEDTNTCLMAHKTGYYSRYLQRYMRFFDDKLCVLFFEDLKKDSQKFMKITAEKLGIDTSFYDNFDFKVKNKTMEVRNQVLGRMYNKIRAWYIDQFYRNKSGIYFGGLLKNTVTRVYKKANFSPLQKKTLDPYIVQKLRKDYKGEQEKLEGLLNRRIPWSD